MEQLTTTKEAVLEAAKCNTVEEAIKTMFPQAFKEEMQKIKPFFVNDEISNNDYLFIAFAFAPDNLGNKCFGLRKEFDWALAEGSGGYQILIPTPKK